MPDTKALFDKISGHYDLLNSVFSAGIDKSWRKKLTKEIPADSFVLDVATGTAEVMIEGFKNSSILNGFGIDPSIEMLKIGKKKLNNLGLSDKSGLFKSAGEDLPFKENSFDAITIAFGIRNTVDHKKSLMEMYRVLKPGGTVAILEFAIPDKTVLSSLYLIYFKHIMPFIGSLFGSKKEYKYLSDSTGKFPQRKAFKDIMNETGFRECTFKELTFGIAIIYTGTK